MLLEVMAPSPEAAVQPQEGREAPVSSSAAAATHILISPVALDTPKPPLALYVWPWRSLAARAVTPIQGG